jgi:SRSO17 transposase
LVAAFISQSVTTKQFAAGRKRLDIFLTEMLVPLGRKDRRHWGGVYLRGLLLEGERKSAGAMAARLPDGNEQSLQQFLNQSPWEWQPLWESMAARVERAFSHAVAWIIDDTGFPKKGQHSVGVARQYSGTLGKTGNCQIAVSLRRADARGSSPLGFRLYLPQEWTEDPARCQAAGVPENASFQPNWQLALGLIDQALEWGLLKPPVVLADAAYGEVTAFRQALEARDLAYAVGLSKALAVWPEPPAGAVPNGTGRGRPVKCMRFGDQKPVPVKELALAHPQRFRTVTWREGSQGPLVSPFWAKRVQAAHGWNHGQAPGKEVWLLVEWPAEEPEPVKYYLCDLPKSRSLRQLVTRARGRWRVEQDYQQMKEELGLDHFEGRFWTGWHHHVTMVMLAHLFLRLEQQRRSSKRTLDAAANSA